MKQLQRTFYPGDEWLYFKVYTGIKTADMILINTLFPLAKKLLREKRIEKWFFIRYADPAFHIRFRVMVTDLSQIGNVMSAFHLHLKKACKEGLIYRMDLSTYNRELERYDSRYMEFSESLFTVDSKCILSLLNHISKSDENFRWIVALKLVDSFFDDMRLGLEKKAACMENMSEAYKKEFGYNIYNAKQLNAIYRARRTDIINVLQNEPEKEELKAAFRSIHKKSQETRRLIGNMVVLPEKNFSSYIHMMMNRLFRNKNRIHELLIYDFMCRYYKSEIAKSKSKNE